MTADAFTDPGRSAIATDPAGFCLNIVPDHGPGVASWATTWEAALAAAKAPRNSPTAERIARNALRRFANAPSPVRKADVLAAVQRIARGLHAIDDGIDVLRAAAQSTPADEPELKTALTTIYAAASEIAALDPDGPARPLRPHDFATSDWVRAAGAIAIQLSNVLAKGLPSARSGPRSAAFDCLILDLARSYAAATGKKAVAAGNADPEYRPPFVRFVTALWADATSEPTPHRQKIENALALTAGVARIETFGPVELREKNCGTGQGTTME